MQENGMCDKTIGMRVANWIFWISELDYEEQ